MSEETVRTIRAVPLSALRPSETNPRQLPDPDSQKELVASVKTHGVLVPLLVRPSGDKGHYEIVAGHRRFAAAKAAGLKVVSAEVRLLDDAKVLELQLIDNLQRADIHPLDEAAHLHRLLAIGYQPEAVAQKIGKSLTYVWLRLQLTHLTPAARKLYLDGVLTIKHASLLARIQPEDQARVLEYAVVEDWTGGGKRHAKTARSPRELASYINSRIYLKLAAAPFDPKDAALVPEAGACTSCPKRTGTTPALFPDVQEAETCTDGACFTRKLDAHVAARVAAAKGSVVKLSRAYGTVAPGHVSRSEWVEATPKSCPHTTTGIVTDADGYEREKLGQTLTVCRTRSCRVHHGHRDESSRANAKAKAANAKARAEAAATQALWRAILDKTTAPLARWELDRIALAFFGDVWHELRKKIVAVMGWVDAKDKKGTLRDLDQLVRARLPKASDAEVARFLVACATARALKFTPAALAEWAKQKRLDVTKIRKGATLTLLKGGKAGRPKPVARAKAKPAAQKAKA